MLVFLTVVSWYLYGVAALLTLVTLTLAVWNPQGETAGFRWFR